MLLFTKCTRRALRREPASVLMTSGRQECVHYWPGRVRSGLEVAQIGNRDTGAWLPPHFTTQRMWLRSPIPLDRFPQLLVTCLHKQWHKIFFSPYGILKSWAVRSLIWSHPGAEAGAKDTNPLLSHRSLCQARWRTSCSRVNFFLSASQITQNTQAPAHSILRNFSVVWRHLI